jgi:hypothetical protein
MHQGTGIRYQQQGPAHHLQQPMMHPMHYTQQYRHSQMQMGTQAPPQQQQLVAASSHREAQHLMHQKLLSLNEQSWVLLGTLSIALQFIYR